MKVSHFSDSHLGAGETHGKRAASGLSQRQEDIIKSFVEAIDLIIEHKPDLCIHSGDLFHTVRPTNKIIAVAAEQFYRLAEVHQIPTVIISGNHDAPKQPHIGAALDIYKHIDNLYISAGTGLEVFEIGQAKIFALPHCLTTAIQKVELTKCLPDKSFKYNLLVMHGVAAGMPEFSMADLGEQELPIDIMDAFDYTALGHYHNFSKVGKTAYYCGSTERLSQDERDHDKGFINVDLDGFKLDFVKVHSRVMIDIKPIEATGKRGDQLAEIIKQKIEEHKSESSIIRLKVTGVTEETLKTIPSEVITELKQKAFSLNISFEKEKAKEDQPQFGRSAIGQIDKGFIDFLNETDLTGFDKERLIKEAMTYLSDE